MEAKQHRLKNHKLGLFARMGGPFNRCFFILEIFADELDPDVITSLLNIKPTKSYKKGQERPRGSQYYTIGGWIIDSGEVLIAEDEDESQHFERWLAELPEDSAAWDQIHNLAEARVRLVGYTDQMNAEFRITTQVSRGLANRNLELIVDPYLELDEDHGECDQAPSETEQDATSNGG
jgi:hypothetical protein